MNRRAITFSVVVLALAIGVALKVTRYSERGDAASTAADAHIAQVMSAHGWSHAKVPEGTTGTIYEQKAFIRPGCDRPVFVAILGGNAEGASFFRQQHGADAAFIQEKVVDHPSGLQRQVTGMVRDVVRMLGFPTKAPMPVLAIAPAPGTTETECSGPPAAAWHF